MKINDSMQQTYPTLRLALFALALCGCSSTVEIHRPDQELLQIIHQNVDDAAAQYKVMKAKLPPGRFPKTYHADSDELETSDSGWWCSGFYPGVLLYLFEQTRNRELYDEALRILKILEKEQYNTGTHDLGFMMFNSFGAANRINPKPEYKDILINSARSLAGRFSPAVGLIKSWDSKEGDYLVIIDNMMNLELLFWAARTSGDASFYDIAVTHADNTIKNHFRDDHSSYHVLNYDPKTGAVNEKKTAQGYSDESAWARGQAWGLYGFVVTYRETKDERYLQQAKHIADFILTHPNLPADKIPYWDFNAPNIPHALRDASAAAIIASALLELHRYVDSKTASRYLAAAETILTTLSSPEYKAQPGTNGGFILKHGVGHFPHGTEIDVPLTYADYYFVEAMRRYKQIFD
ncbi:MAG TPA: glycoside hydrolase family 88 protein [Gammaproteobacteria bacterium]